jgi:hypothetical protein
MGTVILSRYYRLQMGKVGQSPRLSGQSSRRLLRGCCSILYRCLPIHPRSDHCPRFRCALSIEEEVGSHIDGLGLLGAVAIVCVCTLNGV